MIWWRKKPPSRGSNNNRIIVCIYSSSFTTTASSSEFIDSMVEDWIGLEDIPSEWGTFCVDFDDHFWNWPCHWRSMAIIAMIEASAARWSAHSYVHRCCCERVAVLSTRCRGHHLRLFFLLSTAQKLAFLFWLAVYIAHLYLKDRASPGGTLFLLLLFLLLFFLLLRRDAHSSSSSSSSPCTGESNNMVMYFKNISIYS